MLLLSRVFLGMMLFLLLASPALGKRVAIKPADFYVAEDGNDLNPGSLSKPFASLARARDAVQQLKKQKQNQDILVYIRDGMYTLDKPVIFGLEDSGSEKQTITYASYPGELAEFTSAKFLYDWKKPISPQRVFPRALSAEARRNVWILDMPETKGGKWSFKTLYKSNERLIRARKGFDPVIPYEGFESEDEFEGPLNKVLIFPEGVLKNWRNLCDIEISIVPRARWQHNFLGLKSVDEDNQVAITSLACTYQMTKSPQRSPSCYVENVLDYLDEPGEWVLDTKRGKLYYWPKSGNPNREGINTPFLRELIRIEGQIDYEEPVDKPVKYLRFKGFCFTKGDRYSWNAKDATTHSEWELYDKGNALVRLRGAENCIIEECEFTHSGGNAIRLDLHCQKNLIQNNLITHMGKSGIVLCGYGAGTKYVNKNNQIINNLIHDVGELDLNGMGIYISMSGENRVAHNLIYNTPFHGICLTGTNLWQIKDRWRRESFFMRWREIGRRNVSSYERLLPYIYTKDNVIEYNEIHHICQNLGNDNGICISASGRGNIIRRNFIHDIYGEHKNAGIRTDGRVSGTTVEENVIYRCQGGGIALKETNDIINNVIVDMPRGTYYIAVKGGPNKGSKILRNISYDPGKNWAFPVAKSLIKDPNRMPRLEDCQVDYNISFSAGDPIGGWEYLQAHRDLQGSNSIYTDPFLNDLEDGDFRLRSDSPALKLGIKSLDVREMGITRDNRIPEEY